MQTSKTSRHSQKKSPASQPVAASTADSPAVKQRPIGKFLNTDIIITFVFILFCYWILPVKNGYMLRWYEEMSLFEPTGFFFSRFLHYPGGMLRYAGTWLTQFMFYPYLGTTIIIALWLLIAWVTRKALRLSNASAPLAFLVPLALLVSIAQLDEAWLSMKSAGYIFSNTLGYLFTMSALWLYRSVEDKSWLSIIVMIFSASLYFLAGFFALLATLICIIFKLRDCIVKKNPIDWIGALSAIAAVVAVPPLYYTYFNGTTVDNDYLYLKGLPEFLMEKFDVYLWVPFIVASACLLVITVLSVLRLLAQNRWVSYISIASLAVCAIWVVRAEKKNEQIRATVIMSQRVDKNNWTGVRNVMGRIKEPPNFTMLVLENLANVNLGGTNADLSHIKPVNVDARHAESFTQTVFVNIAVNYYAGNLNQAYRWAMEHSVQYGKAVYFLKYMVKVSLLKGELKLAKRYNDMLMRTMFHRKWAEEMNRYIEKPELIKGNTEFENILFFVDSKSDPN